MSTLLVWFPPRTRIADRSWAVSDTPWDEPTTNSPEYRLFLSGEIWREEPWNRIKEGAVRNLLQRMLEVNPAKRITLDQIAQNDWFTM